MTPVLIDDDTLAGTDVVANNAMNRERGLQSYARELGFDLLGWLDGRGGTASRPQRWLDICCGSGRALVEADSMVNVDEPRLLLTGVDLVAPNVATSSTLDLVSASIASWSPRHRYDLITCVHGLHYIGDKLGLIARLAQWLTNDGRFVASFDTRSVRDRDGRPMARATGAVIAPLGMTYNGRRRLLQRDGGAYVASPWRYLGADTAAGPNYTGQPAVASYYDRDKR